MVKAINPFPPEALLRKFSRMAERSRSPDGDRHGDGWGAAWLDDAGRWRSIKSLRPIWEEHDAIRQVPASRFALVHARSSSFPQHKCVPAYIQPFLDGNYAFVFNGLLRGVSLQVPGRIGSQKIWVLLLTLLKQAEDGESSVLGSFAELYRILSKSSRRLQALNIGLCDGKHIYAGCQYESDADYYNLCIHDSAPLKMISSEPLEGFDFQPVQPGPVIRL
ncbi:MAG: hypothetical protein AB1715_10640 [Acidobacteriota bacterium]